MKKPILKTNKSSEIDRVVLEHIKVPQNPPEMILVVGPCRTGTTALGNVFARLGLISYMQPIKSMRRAVEEGAPVIDWTIDQQQRVVFSKETLGAKTESEFFDPVQELLKVGYQARKIHLIGTCRESRATLGSWVQMWGNIPMSGFVESYQLIEKIMKRAQKLGVRTTHYVQEAIGTNNPDLVLERLLDRVKVTLPSQNTRAADWKTGAIFGEENSKTVFFDVPPNRFVAGVKESQSYHFKLLLAQLTAKQDEVLRNKGVYQIYSRFVKKCENDLGITILED